MYYGAKFIKLDRTIQHLQEEPKETNYIHEKYLNDLLMDICNEIYNHTPFEIYNENFLYQCYLELLKLDRENCWIMDSVNDDIVWSKAHNEHYIILRIVGKLLAYINEPFDFIDSLYEDWTDEEIKIFEQKLGEII